MAHRENVAAPSGHKQRVLELRGEAAVDRPHGPLIGGVHFDLPAPEVDHRLDSKCHSCAQPVSRPTLSVMPYLRLLVKLSSDPVTHKVAHDTASRVLYVLLDCRADIAEPGPVVYLRYPNLERSSCDLDDVSSFRARGPDVKGSARVPMERFVHVRDVHVDDVAIFEHAAVG